MAQSIPVLFLLFISAASGVVLFAFRNREAHTPRSMFRLALPVAALLVITLVRLITDAPGVGESPLMYAALLLFAFALLMQLDSSVRRPGNESRDEP